MEYDHPICTCDTYWPDHHPECPVRCEFDALKTRVAELEKEVALLERQVIGRDAELEACRVRRSELATRVAELEDVVAVLRRQALGWWSRGAVDAAIAKLGREA